jgi:hypothetical protein
MKTIVSGLVHDQIRVPGSTTLQVASTARDLLVMSLVAKEERSEY